MSREIRPELSKKNENYISKHRYYELYHFCLQYPEWKESYSRLDEIAIKSKPRLEIKGDYVSDPTADMAIMKNYYSTRMKLVERVAEETDKSLSVYILAGVTEGLTYDKLRAKMNVPCCKDVYYENYRRFFYLLDKER